MQICHLNQMQVMLFFFNFGILASVMLSDSDLFAICADFFYLPVSCLHLPDLFLMHVVCLNLFCLVIS